MTLVPAGVRIPDFGVLVQCVGFVKCQFDMYGFVFCIFPAYGFVHLYMARIHFLWEQNRYPSAAPALSWRNRPIQRKSQHKSTRSSIDVGTLTCPVSKMAILAILPLFPYSPSSDPLSRYIHSYAVLICRKRKKDTSVTEVS
jgi:hypothetical protein